MVIEALIEGTKNIKISQIDNLLTTLLPSVSTSFGRLDFIKYATQAITYNWMSYPIEQLQMPNAENRTSATLNSIWYWISDFPVCARDLQMVIYGKTNIELDEGEDTVLDFFNKIPEGTTSSSNDTPSQTPTESQAPSKPQNESTEPTLTQATEPESSSTTEQESSEPPTSTEPTTSGNEDAQALD